MKLFKITYYEILDSDFTAIKREIIDYDTITHSHINYDDIIDEIEDGSMELFENQSELFPVTKEESEMLIEIFNLK